MFVKELSINLSQSSFFITCITFQNTLHTVRLLGLEAMAIVENSSSLSVPYTHQSTIIKIFVIGRVRRIDSRDSRSAYSQVFSPFFIVCLTFFGNPGSYFDITKDISATNFSLTTIFWSNRFPFYFQISFKVAISEFSSDTLASLSGAEKQCRCKSQERVSHVLQIN